MSELLVNEASTIHAEAAATNSSRAADGLESLIDQLSATLQRSEVAGVSDGQPSATRSEALTSLFVFGLAGARYGVRMSQVLEVQRIPAITKLPNVASWSLGAANLRGDIVSVIDVRRFLNLLDVTAGERLQKLLVLRSLEQDLQVGLAVDRVFGLRHVPSADIQPPSGHLPETVATYLTGTCEVDSQMVLVLDSEHLLKALAAPFAAAS